MQTQPLLSVIIPVYNTGRFLPRCMESLLNQTYENLEILLIDDGSADNSVQLCDQYASAYAHVRVLHKQNGGLGHARNSGLDLAKGEYVTFLDSDDYIDKDMYLCLMAELLKQNADAAFCDFCYVCSDGRCEAASGGLQAGKYTAQDILLAMLGARPEASRDFDFEMSVCKAIYAAHVIRDGKIRFQSEREVLCEDLFFHLDFLQEAESAVYVPKSFYHYCENTNSLTHKLDPDRLYREKKLYLSICQLVQDIANEGAQLRWQRLFLGRIRAAIGQYVHYTGELSFRERLRSIRAIAEDPLVRRIITGYPIYKNPIKLRIFHTFLRWKFCLGMYVLILLKR